MQSYTYILKCADNSYYVGSTKNLNVRLLQHQNGEGANHTKKNLPVELVYFEEFSRIDLAFYREKQIKGWSRKKKEALINHQEVNLNSLSECKNATNSKLSEKTVMVVERLVSCLTAFDYAQAAS